MLRLECLPENDLQTLPCVLVEWAAGVEPIPKRDQRQLGSPFSGGRVDVLILARLAVVS